MPIMPERTSQASPVVPPRSEVGPLWSCVCGQPITRNPDSLTDQTVLPWQHEATGLAFGGLGAGHHEAMPAEAQHVPSCRTQDAPALECCDHTWDARGYCIECSEFDPEQVDELMLYGDRD
jgi:hypothetical protein